MQTFFKQVENRVVAFQKDEQILGYIVFSFKKQSETNFLLNNLVIKEFIYETPEALLELSTFLNSQADQIQRIEWNTHDDNIRFFLADARNSSTSLIPSVYHPSATAGIGLMYRIIHLEKFIQDLQGKRTSSSGVKWQLNVTDTFFRENNVQIILHSENGVLTVSENAEYDEAKDEQSKVEGEIKDMEAKLPLIEVIDETEVHTDDVSIGSYVTVMDMDYNEEVEYRIVGTTESNILEGKLSNESPVGQALIGAKVGDELTIDIPAGKAHYKVLAIR